MNKVWLSILISLFSVSAFAVDLHMPKRILFHPTADRVAEALLSEDIDFNKIVVSPDPEGYCPITYRSDVAPRLQIGEVHYTLSRFVLETAQGNITCALEKFLKGELAPGDFLEVEFKNELDSFVIVLTRANLLKEHNLVDLAFYFGFWGGGIRQRGKILEWY